MVNTINAPSIDLETTVESSEGEIVDLGESNSGGDLAQRLCSLFLWRLDSARGYLENRYPGVEELRYKHGLEINDLVERVGATASNWGYLANSGALKEATDRLKTEFYELQKASELYRLVVVIGDNLQKLDERSRDMSPASVLSSYNTFVGESMKRLELECRDVSNLPEEATKDLTRISMLGNAISRLNYNEFMGYFPEGTMEEVYGSTIVQWSEGQQEYIRILTFDKTGITEVYREEPANGTLHRMLNLARDALSQENFDYGVHGVSLKDIEAGSDGVFTLTEGTDHIGLRVDVTYSDGRRDSFPVDYHRVRDLSGFSHSGAGSLFERDMQDLRCMQDLPDGVVNQAHTFLFADMCRYLHASSER